MKKTMYKYYDSLSEKILIDLLGLEAWEKLDDQQKSLAFEEFTLYSMTNYFDFYHVYSLLSKKKIIEVDTEDIKKIDKIYDIECQRAAVASDISESQIKAINFLIVDFDVDLMHIIQTSDFMNNKTHLNKIARCFENKAFLTKNARKTLSLQKLILNFDDKYKDRDTNPIYKENIKTLLENKFANNLMINCNNKQEVIIKKDLILNKNKRVSDDMEKDSSLSPNKENINFIKEDDCLRSNEEGADKILNSVDQINDNLSDDSDVNQESKFNNSLNTLSNTTTINSNSKESIIQKHLFYRNNKKLKNQAALSFIKNIVSWKIKDTIYFYSKEFNLRNKLFNKNKYNNKEEYYYIKQYKADAYFAVEESYISDNDMTKINGFVRGKKGYSGMKFLKGFKGKAIELKICTSGKRLITKTQYINKEKKILYIFDYIANHNQVNAAKGYFNSQPDMFFTKDTQLEEILELTRDKSTDLGLNDNIDFSNIMYGNLE